MAVAIVYYTVGHANVLRNDDPIGKEAGFGQLAEAANEELRKTGASWFATSDYRTYAMLRWHLRDRIPVVQINERNRYIGFRVSEADFAGPSGLYVAPVEDIPHALWQTTTAVLAPVGEVDLSWRGTRYDRYAMFKLTNWKPVFSPSHGDPLAAARPH